MHAMVSAGIPVWIDNRARIAHNKIIIIDQHLIVGGSYNFTRSAEAANVENVTFIDSVEVAGWYLRNWLERQGLSHQITNESAAADLR